jgi:carbon-monoxide dehydrogenase medium subunit
MAAVSSGWVSKSHRAIPPFDLVRPRTVGDALDALGADSALIAGGIDQVQRLIDGPPVARLVTLTTIPALAEIVEEPAAVRIGACVTHYRIETDPVLGRALPDLAAAWATVGNVRVRMAGTLGGNVMAREANYDGPVLLAAADATLRFATPRGATEHRIADPDPDWNPPENAVLTEVSVPRVVGRRLVFDRSLKPAITLAVALDPEGADGFSGRIAIGCAFARPLCRRFTFGSAPDIGILADKFAALLPLPRHDAFASRDYRRRMAATLIRRHLARMVETKP